MAERDREQGPNQSPISESEEDRGELEKARKDFGIIFDTHQEGPDRTQEVLSRLGLFLRSPLIDGERARKALEECSTATDRDEFIEKSLSAMKPILDLRISNPKAFEELMREEFVERGGFIKVNEILSYGESGDSVHIHLAPAKELGIAKTRKLFLEGMKALAEIVKGNEKMQRITATSWIVAKNPKLLERLGFTVEGGISDDMRRRYFADDNREISTASITRDQFLERYL